MKSISSIIIITLISVLSIGCVTWNAKKDGSIIVTEEIIDEFKRDKEAALKKYRNKTMQVCAEEDIRSRLWYGNGELPLDMPTIMDNHGGTVAAQVFARYYDINTNSDIAQTLGKDIGAGRNNAVPPSVEARYADLLNSRLDFYNTMVPFLDKDKGFGWTQAYGSTEVAYANYIAHFGTDYSNGKSGDPIYMGIPGVYMGPTATSEGNGIWALVEYGYLFEKTFIGSGIYGEYMHMMEKSKLELNTYYSSAQILGKVGSTGRSSGPHLHYTIFTLENHYYSTTTMSMILDNKICGPLRSDKAVYLPNAYKIGANKLTYNIQPYMNDFAERRK